MVTTKKLESVKTPVLKVIGGLFLTRPDFRPTRFCRGANFRFGGGTHREFLLLRYNRRGCRPSFRCPPFLLSRGNQSPGRRAHRAFLWRGGVMGCGRTDSENASQFLL